MAQSLGARTYQRTFDNFAGQRNFALDNIEFSNDWILHLDADHRHYRPGRRLPRRVPLAKARTAASSAAPSFNTDRIDHLPRSRRIRGEPRSALRGPDKRHKPDPGGPAADSLDELQPGGAEPRGRSSFETPENYGQCRRAARCGCRRRSASGPWERKTRFYQASTSEMYGKVQEIPQKGGKGPRRSTHAPLTARQGVRRLDHELPRKRRTLRRQRHSSTTSRPFAARILRHAQRSRAAAAFRESDSDQCRDLNDDCATGLMRSTTPKRNGCACSRRFPTIYVIATGAASAARRRARGGRAWP